MSEIADDFDDLDLLDLVEDGDGGDEQAEEESEARENALMGMLAEVDEMDSRQDEEKQRREHQRMQRLKDSMEKDRREAAKEEEAAAASPAPAPSISCSSRPPPGRKDIRFEPPGLKVFDAPRFLHCFTHEDLSLEGDFGYEKRQRLRQLGIPEAEVERTFSDPYLFILNLAPDACSAMVGSDGDFRQICDHLFFYSSCCTDTLLGELYRKALFGMLKNYSYHWRMGLQHLYAALDNLGMKMGMPRDQGFFRDILSSRLETAARSNKAKGLPRSRFSLPAPHQFFTKRLEARSEEEEKKEDANKSNAEVDEKKRLTCIKNFMGLVSDLSVSHPDRTKFRPTSDDWSHQLVFLYTMLLAATDRYLIDDSILRRHMTLLLHTQINSFSTFQWTGLQERAAFDEASNSANDPASNACCDVTELLAQVGSTHSCLAQMKTWEAGNLPRQDHFDTYDHHHNMVARMDLIPPSLRGNQVRKGVAFLNFQYIIDPAEHTLVIEKFVDELNRLLDVDANMRNFRVLYPEHYVMFSLVSFVDAIVGTEPDDFKVARLLKIDRLRELLGEYSKKKVQTDDVNGFWIQELVQQVVSRWRILKEKHSGPNSGDFD